ncbi:MAG: undecaprenyldiphospho-muramoylpentapeptide beta-N-acetylglucosaminyltransferase [Pseudomonadota bacterium]|nr:undecaprenyldiphospho-muramoylpentapeptide beta-N-acetylglucosaminyltransferase [Pseudomonadota bacterium]
MGAARKPLIALAAGGTGGHVFPALAVAEALRGAGIDTLLMTDRRGARLVPPAGRTVLAAASPFQRGLPRRALALLKLGFGLSQALALMLRRRPAAMVGFGGYPSFAPLLAARLTGVPALLHEQNALLGRANNLLARWTGHLALSWPDTANLPPAVTSFVSGMPVRSAFFAIAPRSDRDSGTLSVTVIGGSLGAAVFADLVPAAVAALPKGLRSRLSVTQQCRAEQLDALTETYAAIGVGAEIATFFDDMPARFAAADLVIARAGASTVAELAAAGRPALLIPFAGAMDDHQTANARQLESAGGGICLAEAGLDAADLAAVMARLLGDPAKCRAMGLAGRDIAAPDAAQAIADHALARAGLAPSDRRAA